MSKYHVDLDSPPKGVVVPPLLKALGAFVAKQDHGTLGFFDALRVAKIPKAMAEKEGFSFLELPDGSLLALVRNAVMLLDSEGDKRELASSLEEFLLLWSENESGVDELDDGEHGTLAKWLASKKVKAPKKTAKKSGAAAPAARRSPTAAMKQLGPKLRALASVMGLRADAPEVDAYVTKTLGKKTPTKTTRDDANVSAPKLGLELVFSHDVRNDAYPPIPNGKAFVPYLAHAFIKAQVGEDVLGVPWNADAARVTKLLGPPTGERSNFDDVSCPFWIKEVDSAAEVVVELEVDDGLSASMFVRTAADLDRFAAMPTAVFVAWAATHGLLDETRCDIAPLKSKAVRGSEFLKTALPRGLWDDHLKANTDLRAFAYGYFHRIGDVGWLKADLDELGVKSDDWASVEKASRRLSQRFAKFL